MLANNEAAACLLVEVPDAAAAATDRLLSKLEAFILVKLDDDVLLKELLEDCLSVVRVRIELTLADVNCRKNNNIQLNNIQLVKDKFLTGVLKDFDFSLIIFLILDSTSTFLFSSKVEKYFNDGFFESIIEF